MAELTDQQRAQVAQRDHLARAIILSVDQVMMDPQVRDAVEYAPAVVRTRVAVTATVAALIANGCIAEQAPDWFAIDLPEHLRPDVDAMVEGNRAVREIFFPTDPR